MNTRLFRSRDDRMIAGVAGGLAELWGADPSLVRLGWALLAIFTGGIALIVYIVLAIVVPEEDDLADWTDAEPGGEARRDRPRRRLVPLVPLVPPHARRAVNAVSCVA